MKQYLDLMRDILDNGTWQDNRTGIRTKMLPGAMLKFDLRDGFPAVTTKQLAFKQVKGELLGFLRGCDSASQFRGLGCSVWDANASAPAWVNSAYMRDLEEGDLGRIYGVQWKDWNSSEVDLYTGLPKKFDQIENLIDQIRCNPTSRRLLVTALRPDEFHKMALPPCHYTFQIIIEQGTRTMHLLWNQRSCDMFLGVPFNIASYALLLSLIAKVTGYDVGTLTGFLADVHIYENHLEQVVEQLSRECLSLSELRIDSVTFGQPLETIQPEDIGLGNYVCHPPIKAPMAV